MQAAATCHQAYDTMCRHAKCMGTAAACADTGQLAGSLCTPLHHLRKGHKSYTAQLCSLGAGNDKMIRRISSAMGAEANMVLGRAPCGLCC